MTALTPELIAAYVRALSCDVTSVGVGAPGAPAPAGRVVRARSGDVEVVIGLGPHALAPLAAHDAGLAARALTDGRLTT